MDRVHEMALRAAARVALALTVAGCGTTVELADGGTTSAGAGGAHGSSSRAGATTQVSASSGAGGAGGAGGAATATCEATALGEQVSLDPASFACCADFL